MKLKNHKLTVSYTFTGTVNVNAKSKAHAMEIVKRDFGMVAGSISCSNPSDRQEFEGVSHWDINIHPTAAKIT